MPRSGGLQEARDDCTRSFFFRVWQAEVVVQVVGDGGKALLAVNYTTRGLVYYLRFGEQLKIPS